MRFTLFKRPVNLQTLREALPAVQSTSVETEKAFNAWRLTLVSFIRFRNRCIVLSGVVELCVARGRRESALFSNLTICLQ